MEREKQELDALPPDYTPIPDNVIDDDEADSYIRTRLYLSDTLLHHFRTVGGPVDAVKTSLDHLLDMKRFYSRDGMDLEYPIPALYIRLHRDQEAYDFSKMHAIITKKLEYAYHNTGLSSLHVKDADVFESPNGLWANDEKWIDFRYAVAVTLVKLRILFDLQAIQNAIRAFTGVFPPEIIDLIRLQLVGSVIESRPKVLHGSIDETASLIKTIKKQLRDLFKSIAKSNRHFWPLFLEDAPTAALTRPVSSTPGSMEEAKLILAYNYAAWAETPGAIDVIRTLS
ncbi:hypothetical protein G7Z17_g2258 [Cylindrodendrum hubeiense]|uniref:Uncharacterized protein n=1 Tax=Cylindrodendrum hubeiense TaxID=595255 RepID=A0A9P5HGZ9_9HYPO|nr:hypothetical protein G7Z17_g2258 [Cylindrodendrum hubeiense]